MNKINSGSGSDNNKDVGNISEVKSKTISPAVLGIPKSHGMKLSLNMTSQDKKELLTKLEEWRKARMEKLAASILAKQKQVEKPKMCISLPGRSKSHEIFGPEGKLKIEGKEPVFERLYKNLHKPRKQECQVYSSGSSERKKFVSEKSFPLNTCMPIVKSEFDEKAIENVQFISDLKECCTDKNGRATQNKLRENAELEVNMTANPKLVIDENGEDLLLQTRKCLADNEIVKNNFEETQLMIPAEIPIPETNFKILEEKAVVKSGNDNLDLPIKMTTVDSDSRDKKPNTASKNSDVICQKSDSDINLVQTFKNHIRPNNKNEAHKKIISNVSILKCVPPKSGTQLTTTEKPQNSLRRSISMIYRQKHKTSKLVHRTLSAKNLNEFELGLQETDFKSQHLSSFCKNKGIKEKKGSATKLMSYVTPKQKGTLNSTHLRTKLEEWLMDNSHPLEGYRHLRCFGIPTTVKPFEAPYVVPSKDALKSTYTRSTPDIVAEESDKENITPMTVNLQVEMSDVENWLKELHHLIVDLKYPSDRCEEWLTAIRKKCGNCVQSPIYWECLAALHESKGDIKSAIENYERAIIKGGEVDAVGDSLAQLFDKMVIEQEKPMKPKLEKGLDPKNIFKSTIIKFALQQKALKELDPKLDAGARQQLLIATPVRRSSRIQTPFKSNVVTSLQSLTPELRKSIKFKPNESLLGGN